MSSDSVTVEGVAREAKSGPVIVANDGTVYYVEGLQGDSWPNSLCNQKVINDKYDRFVLAAPNLRYQFSVSIYQKSRFFKGMNNKILIISVTNTS